MTKRQMLDLARTLKKSKPYMSYAIYRVLCEDLADFCERHNTELDLGRSRFLTACEHDVDDNAALLISEPNKGPDNDYEFYGEV